MYDVCDYWLIVVFVALLYLYCCYYVGVFSCLFVAFDRFVYLCYLDCVCVALIAGALLWGV